LSCASPRQFTALEATTLLGWEPSHPTLLEDIAAGHFPGN
jgi:hypothetical protein